MKNNLKLVTPTGQPSTRGRHARTQSLQAHTPSIAVKRLVSHPNATEAIALANEQAGLEFDTEEGASLQRLRSERDQVKTDIASVEHDVAVLEAQKAETPELIPRNARQDDEEAPPVPFSDWQRMDQVTFTVFIVLLLISLSASFANVYANLVASGEPVFIEHPWIAASLAALAPLSSIAVKWLGHYFNSPKARIRYAIAVHVSTLVMLLIWSVLTVISFPGVASPLQLDLNGGFDTGPLYVWAQLILEVLVASCLWLAIEDIHSRYVSGEPRPNPEHEALVRAIEKLRKALEHLRTREGELTETIDHLEAARQAYINSQLIAFHHLKSRFAELFSL